MRGAERPGKIQWTRPFLQPLRTLSSEAARELFADICEPVEDENQVTQLLKVTDNLPLAVTLIAHLASYEGCESVLERWENESTFLLSDGLDKRSSLDKSIILSLTSPRMVAAPGSRELLSLLSLLPDGVSEETLERAGVPLTNISRCRVTLCRTSLAFIDRDDRLKVLAPIREYVRRKVPPFPDLIRPLQNFMYDLLKPFEIWDQTPDSGMFRRVSEDIGNINSLIEHAMNEPTFDMKQTIYCVIYLSTCLDFASMLDDPSFRSLIVSLEEPAERTNDSHLQGHYFLAAMRTQESVCSVDTMESWAEKALRYFGATSDVAGQGMS